MFKKVFGISILVLTLVLFFSFPFLSNFTNKNLSEISIKESPTQPWFLENEKEKFALVYFGYVGCTTVCIPSLTEIAEIYKKLDEKNLNIPFYFANIDYKIPSNLPDIFAKSFDKRFNGIYNDSSQINKLKQDFNLLINESVLEITHSSNLYLFKRENDSYKLYKIYITHPYDIKLLIKALSN